MKASAGRVLMLVEYPYPEDSRVRNEATLLMSFGYQISVISVKKGDQKTVEVVNGVHVYRVPPLEIFKKTGSRNPGWIGTLLLKLKSFLGYVAEYCYFTAACFIMACYVFVKRGFDVIHAHNPPDTLFAVALPFKLLGKKFIFDHHDLCPELYMSRYRTQGGILVRLLKMTEWCNLKLADVVIATHESYKAGQIVRAKKNTDRIFVVRNGPDQRRMTVVDPSPHLKAMRKCILCYVGSLNPQDGVDYLLRSLHHLRHDFNRDDFHCVIM